MAIGSALVDWVSHHRSAQLAIGRSVQPLVGRSVQPLVDRFSHQLSHTVLLQIFARVKFLRFSQFEPNFNILRSYFCDRGCYPQKLVYR